jgi:CrcB protein
VIPALVAIGGGVGAVLRYWLGVAVQGTAAAGSFPLGTLVVNVCGCCAIGILAELAERRGLSAEGRAFLMVGILGGFTTFSAFANETVNAVRTGAAVVAALNVAGSVLLCLAATWAGRGVAALMLR